MATLTIKTFLSIKSAEVELRRFSVFIGPQAQGKSLVVKLAYFFDKLLRNALLTIVPGEQSIASLKKESLETFQLYFPKYTWGATAFTITYRHEGCGISIERKGGRTNNPATLQISDELQTKLNDMAARYKEAMESSVERVALPSVMRRRSLDKILAEDTFTKRFTSSPIFIPASRAFFANIEKNIFTLISSRFDIDPLMAEFGSTLERTRGDLLFGVRMSRGVTSRKQVTAKEARWKDIIQGVYLYDGKDELIETAGRRVRLANSSSGQQEVIPLLLVLAHEESSPRGLRSSAAPRTGGSFYIEEPEAHLFPRAQRKIAHLMTEIANREPQGRMVFTTHSPYMLTAINNLALAGKLYQSLDASATARAEKIVPKRCSIPPAELAAYKVDEGVVEPIKDEISGLVNGYLVDQVSQEFATEFDDLLSLAPNPQASSSGIVE
jgi:hypothetical protein